MSPKTTASLRNVPATLRARLRLLRCCVCRRPRDESQALHSLVCARATCERTYRRMHARRRTDGVTLPLPPVEVPACSVCRWPLTPPELDQAGMWTHVSAGRGVCADVRCRDEWNALRREEALAEARDEERLARKLERHRDEHAAEHGVSDAERHPVVRIPANRRRLVNLAESRKRCFRDRLYGLIAQALVPRAEGEVPEPLAPPVPEAAVPGVIRACTLCRGNCCFFGADHAHLHVDDIRRHMAAHPEQRPRDVHAAFVARLGNRVYEDSCLFHGEQGCGLGELRGQNCRWHYCPDLRRYVEEVGEGASPRACFVSLGPGLVNHYAPGQEPTSESEIVGEAFVGGADDGGDAQQ